MNDVVVERCAARAALAGNPSDGYGGAVVAVPVRSVAAVVTASLADGIVVRQDGVEPIGVADLDGLQGCEPVTLHEHRLVLATLAEFDHRWRLDSGVALEVATTIPRSVGLAGSSAIVIAALRALFGIFRRPLPHVDVLASVARSIEADRIGIPAGLQDRVVQTHDQPMMMRFGPGHVRNVGGMKAGTYEPAPVTPDFWLFVAARVSSAASSQIVHDELRARFDAGDVGVVTAMRRLAGHAERAAEALRLGDRARLGAAMDATVRERSGITDLDPAHVEMIEVARAAGTSANSTGSGGAIVVSAPDAATAERAAADLDALGCMLLPVQL